MLSNFKSGRSKIMNFKGTVIGIDKRCENLNPGYLIKKNLHSFFKNGNSGKFSYFVFSRRKFIWKSFCVSSAFNFFRVSVDYTLFSSFLVIL